jgi:hypothetical protein
VGMWLWSDVVVGGGGRVGVGSDGSCKVVRTISATLLT